MHVCLVGLQIGQLTTSNAVSVSTGSRDALGDESSAVQALAPKMDPEIPARGASAKTTSHLQADPIRAMVHIIGIHTNHSPKKTKLHAPNNIETLARMSRYSSNAGLGNEQPGRGLEVRISAFMPKA